MTPSSLLGKAKKLMASSILEQGSKSTEKTSTVNKPKPRGRPKKVVVEAEEETEGLVLAGSELDMESEEDDIMLGEMMGLTGEDGEGIMRKKTGGVKLSSLLPRGMGKVASPASSISFLSSTRPLPKWVIGEDAIFNPRRVNAHDLASDWSNQFILSQ